MADEAIELIEAPDTCEDTIEYDNRIDDDIEIEPEEEELGIFDTPKNWEEIEQKFARYERNYRARRIRELTLAPLKNKRGSRISRTASEAAA